MFPDMPIYDVFSITCNLRALQLSYQAPKKTIVHIKFTLSKSSKAFNYKNK